MKNNQFKTNPHPSDNFLQDQEHKELPKTLQKKILRDSALFFVCFLVCIYIGATSDTMFFVFAIMIIAGAYIFIQGGILTPYKTGHLKEIRGVIIKSEYEDIPVFNKKTKLMPLILYIQDDKKNVYRIRITEQKRFYETGYIVTFYVLDKVMQKKDFCFDCGTPLSITITDISL